VLGAYTVQVVRVVLHCGAHRSRLTEAVLRYPLLLGLQPGAIAARWEHLRATCAAACPDRAATHVAEVRGGLGPHDAALCCPATSQPLPLLLLLLQAVCQSPVLLGLSSAALDARIAALADCMQQAQGSVAAGSTASQGPTHSMPAAELRSPGEGAKPAQRRAVQLLLGYPHIVRSSLPVVRPPCRQHC
jgi:hypothetical protein